jgi:hypothetical protein
VSARWQRWRAACKWAGQGLAPWLWLGLQSASVCPASCQLPSLGGPLRRPSRLPRPSRAVQEELDRQSPVVEDIDRQLNRVTSKLKSNNAKLKGLVLQVRAPGPGFGRRRDSLARAPAASACDGVVDVTPTAPGSCLPLPPNLAAPQLRSRRNFCIDIILVCIVLGIIAYIVSMVQVRAGGAGAAGCASRALVCCPPVMQSQRRGTGRLPPPRLLQTGLVPACHPRRRTTKARRRGTSVNNWLHEERGGGGAAAVQATRLAAGAVAQVRAAVPQPALLKTRRSRHRTAHPARQVPAARP